MFDALKAISRNILCTYILLLLLTGCTTTPTNFHKPQSYAIEDPSYEVLHQRIQRQIDKHPDKSGFYVLSDNLEAFAARMTLASEAEHTLDLQYYLFYDNTGGILAHELLSAADRGVRVRILIDDVDTAGRDPGLALFSVHPNIEVRLFNPFPRRGILRNLSWATDFSRLNHRMHNKSFIADNSVAIVGGRNIADPYFSASQDHGYADLDVMTIGPLVPEVSQAFDDYWNSEQVFPIEAYENIKDKESAEERARTLLQTHYDTQKDSEFLTAVSNVDLIPDLINGTLELSWAKGAMFYDRPEKVTTDDKTALTHLGPQIAPMLNNAKKEVFLVSPYFVPGQSGLAWMEKMLKKGVAVKVLTNSMASNDVRPVHAGYARYRSDMLDLGVELFELRPTVASADSWDTTVRSRSIKVSLHAKVFVIDSEKAFFGSANLDPRSRDINTEHGIVVESKEVTGQILAAIHKAIAPTHSFRVTKNGVGRLQWATEEAGQSVIYYQEPLVCCWDHLQVRLISLLPFENQL